MSSAGGRGGGAGRGAGRAPTQGRGNGPITSAAAAGAADPGKKPHENGLTEQQSGSTKPAASGAATGGGGWGKGPSFASVLSKAQAPPPAKPSGEPAAAPAAPEAAGAALQPGGDSGIQFGSFASQQHAGGGEAKKREPSAGGRPVNRSESVPPSGGRGQYGGGPRHPPGVPGSGPKYNTAPTAQQQGPVGGAGRGMPTASSAPGTGIAPAAAPALVAAVPTAAATAADTSEASFAAPAAVASATSLSAPAAPAPTTIPTAAPAPPPAPQTLPQAVAAAAPVPVSVMAPALPVSAPVVVVNAPTAVPVPGPGVVLPPGGAGGPIKGSGPHAHAAQQQPQQHVSGGPLMGGTGFVPPGPGPQGGRVIPLNPAVHHHGGVPQQQGAQQGGPPQPPQQMGRGGPQPQGQQQGQQFAGRQQAHGAPPSMPMAVPYGQGGGAHSASHALTNAQNILLAQQQYQLAAAAAGIPMHMQAMQPGPGGFPMPSAFVQHPHSPPNAAAGMMAQQQYIMMQAAAASGAALMMPAGTGAPLQQGPPVPVANLPGQAVHGGMMQQPGGAHQPYLSMGVIAAGPHGMPHHLVPAGGPQAHVVAGGAGPAPGSGVVLAANGTAGVHGVSGAQQQQPATGGTAGGPGAGGMGAGHQGGAGSQAPASGTTTPAAAPVPQQPPPKRVLAIKDARTGAALDLNTVKQDAAAVKDKEKGKERAAMEDASAVAAAAAVVPAASAASAAATPVATQAPAAQPAVVVSKPAPVGSAAREIKPPPADRHKPGSAPATKPAPDTLAAAPATELVSAGALTPPAESAAPEPPPLAPAAAAPATLATAPADQAPPAPTTPEAPAPAPAAASEAAAVRTPEAEVPTAIPPTAPERPVPEGPAGEAPTTPTPGGSMTPVAPAAAAAHELSLPAEDAAGAKLGGKGGKSLKDIARRAEGKEEQLKDRADPFAAPKPPPAAVEPAVVSGRVAAAGSQQASAVASQQQSPERPARTAAPTPPLPPPPPPEEQVSDNWERAAEDGRDAKAPGGGAAVAAVQPVLGPGGRKQYTRDFLRSLGRCYNRPKGIEHFPFHQEIVLDVPRQFDMQDITFELTSMGSGHRAGRPRAGGGGGGPPPSMSGGMGGRPDDDWGNRRIGPMGTVNYGQDPRMGPGGRGPPPGREIPRALDRRGLQQVDEKWERRGPPPPSPSHGRMGGRNDSLAMVRGQSGVLTLHRSERRFVVGQAQTEDPEEEKRQKQFQGILNKITPDNFERLTKKILEEVGITEQRTLEGLIDKIFDKALTDTHFCELYASMCREVSMHDKCPKFSNPDVNGKPIDLRRLILYKCQEEFEKGSKAMEDVAAREAAEASSGDKSAEGTASATEEPQPQGTADAGGATPLAAEGAASAEDPKLAERKKADADRAARRRMLGNIQFISYLFKMGLLTERIMHSCLQTLLKEQDNPRGEDVECLCKLLTVVGAQLDTTSKPEHKNAMKIYFDRMERMQKDTTKLESRIRFMIQDVLDLRANKWVPRTKKEGPKKIEDVHREAQQELMAQQQRDADERRRGGGGGGGGGRDRDRGGYGGPPPPRQGPGYGDARLLSRDEVPSRTIQMQRAQSTELSFRPGGAGGYGRGAATRNASPGPAAAAAAAMAGGRQPSLVGAAAGTGAATPFGEAAGGKAAAALQQLQPCTSSSGKVAVAPPQRQLLQQLPLEQMKISVESLVKEFFIVSNHSVEQALDSLLSLRERGADMGQALPLVLTAALEQRGLELHDRLDPMASVFEAAMAQGASEAAGPVVLTPEELEAGAMALARDLHSLAEDQPKAPLLMGPLLAGFVSKGWLSIKSVLGEVLTVPPMEEGAPDPPLVEAGGAPDLLIGLMSKLKELKGEDAAAAAWKEAGLDASLFFDEFAREEPEKISQQLREAGLPFLCASA